MSSITASPTRLRSNTPPADGIKQTQNTQVPPSSSGLDHLVEAATALTQLVRTGSSSKVNQDSSKQTNQISDDEDSKSKQSSVASSSAPSSAATTVSNHPAIINGADNLHNKDFPPLSSVTQVASASVPALSNSVSVVPIFKPTSENTKEIFPRRLLRILADPTIADIITWLPHGRAFVILKTDELAETVLPKYFPESCSNANSKKGNKSNTCKYPSFTRKLNRWGFRQVTRGPDSGAFHHKHFVREEPELCLKMVCQRTIKRNKTEGGFKKHSDIKPAATQILGPYSAALRAQPVESLSSNLNANAAFNVQGVQLQNKQFTSFVETHSDSSNVQNSSATIISARSSCNSPTPNMNQLNGSVSSLLSPSIAAQQAGANNSPSSQMVRTVSTTSSLQNSGSMNANLSFPVFHNNGAQIDPRILLQHNFATNAYNTANSTFSNTAAPAPTTTTPASNSNISAMPQLPQASSMPNYITLVDAKSANQHQTQHTQQPVVAPTTQLQNNASKFKTPIAPAATVASVPAVNNNQQIPAPTPSALSGQSNSFVANHTQQRPQQTDAEIRVANAKSMLYKAFLEALG